MIRLTWQDNSYNEIGFEIQRQKSGEPDFSYLKSFSSPAEDSTATTGITHYYRVRAYNMRGFSSFTATASATVPTGSPAAPSNLSAEFMFGAGQVRLAWSDNANNEMEFRIERKSEYQPSWQQIDTVGPNVTTYYDSNVQGDTFYYYRVRAYNPSGFSGYSNEVQIYVPWF